MKKKIQKALIMATLGIITFASSTTTMAASIMDNYQQTMTQNLSTWTDIRDGIVNGIVNNITGGTTSSIANYYEDEYIPPPHRHHHHHRHHVVPHHYYWTAQIITENMRCP